MVVLSFEKPLSHLRDIVQYEAQCKGPGNEMSVGYTRNGSEREIVVKNLAPNRQYNCKVSIVYFAKVCLYKGHLVHLVEIDYIIKKIICFD